MTGSIALFRVNLSIMQLW